MARGKKQEMGARRKISPLFIGGSVSYFFNKLTCVKKRHMAVYKSISVALCLFSLSGCTDRRPLPGDGTYVIRNDGGGQLISAEADRAVLRLWGGPVVIEGYCNSACLMFTTLSNACLDRDLTLGFHGANVNVGFVGNPQITKYLRNGVKQKFVEEWQFVPFTEIHRISAEDYVRLDPETKICES